MVKSVAGEFEKEENEVTPGSTPGNTDIELDFVRIWNKFLW